MWLIATGEIRNTIAEIPRMTGGGVHNGLFLRSAEAEEAAGVQAQDRLRLNDRFGSIF
jgi:hypothetical protein